MTDATKLMAGLLLISVPTIEFGGTFLLRVLSGKHSELTDFQRSMFRAGHAHAGVLVILALVAQGFTDQAALSAHRMGGTDWICGGSRSGERRVFRRGHRQK